jgi:hypothetical protein
MKKNIFLFFFVLVTSFSFGQIMPPYNCNVISLSNPNNISDSIITDPDSVQLTDVEFVFVISLADVSNTDSVFIKLESNNVILFDSFILPNNITNSPVSVTAYSNTFHISLGSYSNLNNYLIEYFLKDNNGISSVISSYPDSD